jgi:hypothetical protein
MSSDHPQTMESQISLTKIFKMVLKWALVQNHTSEYRKIGIKIQIEASFGQAAMKLIHVTRRKSKIMRKT